MMSAAVPCMGALMAAALAYWRSAWFATGSRQVQAPSETVSTKASFARLVVGSFHVTLHPGIALEVKIHVTSCASPRPIPAGGPARMPTFPYIKPKLNGLGGSTLIGADFTEGVETPRRRGLMDIAVFGKARQQTRIARQMRHDAQFNL